MVDPLLPLTGSSSFPIARQRTKKALPFRFHPPTSQANSSFPSNKITFTAGKLFLTTFPLPPFVSYIVGGDGRSSAATVDRRRRLNGDIYRRHRSGLCVVYPPTSRSPSFISICYSWRFCFYRCSWESITKRILEGKPAKMSSLQESLNKFKQQQEKCQSTLTSIAKRATPSKPSHHAQKSAGHSSSHPAKPPSAPVKFSNDTERLQHINSIRKSPVGAQLKRVLDLLFDVSFCANLCLIAYRIQIK